MNRLRRALVGTSVLGALTSILLLGPVPPGQAVPEGECKDVVFFGLAGSSQHKDDRYAHGPQVWFTMQAIKKAVPDLDYADFSMPYDALGVETMAPSRAQWVAIASAGASIAGSPAELSRYATASAVGSLAVRSWLKDKVVPYLKSIETGVANLAEAVPARAWNCPDESIVLIGYSQGAAAIHRYLNDLDRKRDFDTMDRIAAVVLIADPDRFPNGVPVSMGSAADGSRGVELWVPGSLRKGLSTRTITDIPEDLADITVTVCDDQDFVCDFTPRKIVKGRAGSMGIHGSYVENPDDPKPELRSQSPAIQDAVAYVANLL
jgi:hypothetical protein